MARTPSEHESTPDAPVTRRLRPRRPSSRVETPEVNEDPKSSSDDSLILQSGRQSETRKSKKPQIEKIIKKVKSGSAKEAKYLCRKKGSQKDVTLKESELEHVPELLASFKRSKAAVTIPDSDDSSHLTDAPSSEELNLSDESASSDDRGGKRARRGKKVDKNLRKRAAKNQENVRRSTRDTRNQTKYDFSTTLDEEELVKVDSDTPKKKKRGRQSRRAVESSDVGSEEDDLLEPSRENASSRRSRQVTSAHENNNTSGRARDEHQPTCSRCSYKYQPNLVQLWTRMNKNRRAKARTGSLLDRFQTLDDVYKQGCWLECSTCTNSYHFGCLPVDMKKDISTQHRKERLDLIQQKEMLDPSMSEKEFEIPVDKKEQQPDIKLSLKCPSCVKPYGSQCMICGKHHPANEALQDGVQPKPDIEAQPKTCDEAADSAIGGKLPTGPDQVATCEPSKEIKESVIFRCTSCKRAAHYTCLPSVGDEYPTELEDIAEYWQTDWTCAECDELANISVEFILAWRKPVPKALDTAKDALSGTQELIGSLHDQPKARLKDSQSHAILPKHKDPFEQAEYLCKFEDFSFTDCSWITHSYLVAKHAAKLRNFLTKGPTLDLKQYSGGDFDDSGDSDSDEDSAQDDGLPFNIEPDRDAQMKIPKAWLTPDRILSIEFEDEVVIDDMNEADIPDTPEEMYEMMERAYIKWEEQSYDDATWSDKTPRDSPYFPAFMSALKRYMQFQKFVVPTVKSPTELAKLEAPRGENSFTALDKQPDFIPNQLMGFQLEGLNFCYYNWHRQHPTILADEMGLGKTVQICSLISVLKNKEKRMPFLIVVPNSTLGNWSRECAKWIPDVKCVALPGDSQSCEVVQDWELFKTVGKAKRQLAACVVLATYQSAEKHVNLLGEIQRWEVVIVDEGQRLKAGPKGGLFRALNSLKVGHRILMSGTPLNNNLRELFNLLSFLNPKEYPPSVVDEKELRYSALTPELIDELRTIIRPYMLRRTKETVLDLPPLTEIIVPITMRPLQKQVYRGLLSKNAHLITSIYSKGSKQKKTTRAGFANLLMQLRKTLGHPYLYDPEIEPSDVTDSQVQESLVEGSAKLVFLRKFMPKLLARGHRMLIFSQFTMFLDVMERFLDGEKIEYLRLDGSTSQLDRQTRIDHFNRKNSNYNVFLLSTKAGGAGINLATADVVIILDPDWNPHNDLQAVSRAHRFGQQKPVSVFKLMVKGSAEEKIVQTGKRKLVLDHLVIQKASEEEIEANDVASILQYGAQELLTASDEALQQDVRYTDEELDDLIQRTAEGAKPKESTDDAKADKSFAFARVWEGREKGLTTLDVVEEDQDASNAHEQRSFWDSILQANEAERAKQDPEETGRGRGHRRRKDVDYNMPQMDLMIDSPTKKSGLNDDLSSQGDENYEPALQKEDSSESNESEAEMDALPDIAMLTAPPPTKEQLDANRRAEERIKAQRRQEKWERKYRGLLEQQSNLVNQSHHHCHQVLPPVPASSSSVQPMAGPSDVSYNSMMQTHDSKKRANKPSHEARHRPAKVSRVERIDSSDLGGTNNEETRRKMDTIWSWLMSKAKLLHDSELDGLLSSARSLGLVEQAARMQEAKEMIKRLMDNQRNMAAARHGQKSLIPHQPAPEPSSASHYQRMPTQLARHTSGGHHQQIGQQVVHSQDVSMQAGSQSSTYYNRPVIYQQKGHPSNHHQQYSIQPRHSSHVSGSSRQAVVIQPSSSSHAVVPSGSAHHHASSRPIAPVPLPPPKFTDSNPQSIKPLLAQQNPSLYPRFSRAPAPPSSSSSSSKRNRKGDVI